MYICLSVKYALFLSDFSWTWVFWTDHRKIVKYQVLPHWYVRKIKLKIYTHIAVNMYVSFNATYHKGPILPKKKEVKNQIVILSLTHAPLSHTNDIIQSITSDGRKLKHILRNKIFLVVVFP